MNINKEIKNVMVSIKDTNDENTKNLLKKRLGVMKFIKTAFMEYLTDTENFENILAFKNAESIATVEVARNLLTISSTLLTGSVKTVSRVPLSFSPAMASTPILITPANSIAGF